MYTLRSIARRGSLLGTAAALLTAAVIPAAPAFADALNPLTDRSLTLSSSSPGWNYTDGSGNATYAPPNSGANGQKTGNTFTFKVSTDSTSSNTVKGFTFQYCTTSAGNCTAPGNNGQAGGVRNPDSVSAKTSDLNVVTSSPSEVTSAIGSTVNATSGAVVSVPAPTSTGQNFVVLYKSGASWVQSTGWAMSSEPKEDGTIAASTATGANNYIKLTNSTGGLTLPSTGEVKIVFFGTDTNYITNPGAGAFFVKINDYNSATTLDDTTLVDGGVTVANVMNRSIEIQTKVLETMSFSVGTVDPYTLESDGSNTSEFYAATGLQTHGPCDPILTGMTPNDPNATVNILQMGNEAAENSLETDKTYSTHSYWRLSSNSSAGATVYYSGVTLSNTVGDQIDAIGPTATQPHVGSEQFGLALANGITADNATGPFEVDYDVERANGFLYENGNDTTTNGIHASVATDVGGNASYHTPRLFPLVPHANYEDGAGAVNANYNGATSAPIDTSFAFDPTSNTIPVPLADESTSVVDCVTAKMRYIANIAATTPAGIYATKINYIAAPQY